MNIAGLTLEMNHLGNWTKTVRQPFNSAGQQYVYVYKNDYTTNIKICHDLISFFGIKILNISGKVLILNLL